MSIEIGIHPSRRHEDGLAAISIRAPALGQAYELDLPFAKLYGHCGVPDPVTLDFLLVASLCYVIDKIVPRKTALDHWTRALNVEFPVSSPEVWVTVAHEFENALSFLTGDEWQISFREADVSFFKASSRRRRPRSRMLIPRRTVTAVCLFSGGVDSLVGSINLLARNDKQNTLLIGHYDAPGPATQQQQLFTKLQQEYPGRAELLQTRVSHKPAAALELTLRSRSLVFIALGIYAARAFGSEVPVYVPENGFIAVNIPLTPSRSGSCSTRTMHPFFLDRLGAVLNKLGFANKIINPFKTQTKGECLVNCANRPLLKSLVDASVSCSHGSRKQYWLRKDMNNCGYCVPCIVRRSALHQAGLDRGQKYGIDICAGELPIDDERESADDLRAILDFLSHGKTAMEISREIKAVAPVNNIEACVAMVERGFEEIRTLFHDKATPSIRRAANVESPQR